MTEGERNALDVIATELQFQAEALTSMGLSYQGSVVHRVADELRAEMAKADV